MVYTELNEVTGRHEFGWKGPRPDVRGEAEALREYVRLHDLRRAIVSGCSPELGAELLSSPGWKLLWTGYEYAASMSDVRVPQPAPLADELRIADPSDAPKVQALINDARAGIPDLRVSLASVKDDLFNPGCYGVLLRSDGQDVAFGHAMVEEDAGEINWVCVRPEHQGRGFGRRVLDCLIRHLAESQVKEVNLWLVSDTPWAAHSYESAGFTKTGNTICFITYDRALGDGPPLPPLPAGHRDEAGPLSGSGTAGHQPVELLAEIEESPVDPPFVG